MVLHNNVAIYRRVNLRFAGDIVIFLNLKEDLIDVLNGMDFHFEDKLLDVITKKKIKFREPSC